MRRSISCGKIGVSVLGKIRFLPNKILTIEDATSMNECAEVFTAQPLAPWEKCAHAFVTGEDTIFVN
jgi:hypothetical protein